MRTTLIAAVVLALFATDPARAQVSEGQVIEGILKTFQTAFNGKDAATLASLYADDAVLMPPGSPLLKGRTAVDAAAKAIVARGGSVQFDPPAVEVTGNRAVAVGTYSVTISTPGPTAGTLGRVVVRAKYLTVFKRIGSTWKIAYDMQNADEAMPR